MTKRFSPPPTTLSRAEFVKRFESIYEHSAWIAELVWDGGLSPDHDTLAGMAAAMKAVLETVDDEAKLALICAHPDLAGRAAMRAELSADSASEQAGAGLDQCTPEQFACFGQLNAAYRKKFGFPFIIAVKGKTRTDILEAFKARLANSLEVEFDTALEQIHRIALLRLKDLQECPITATVR